MPPQDDKPKRKRSPHGLPKPVKRADGRWMARIELGYVAGTRKRKYVYGATERDVTAQLKTLLHQQQQGVNIAPERQTVAQFLERWMRDVVALRTAPKTQEMYAASVARIKRHIGHVQLAKLAPQHVQQLFRALGDESNPDGSPRYKPATIQRTRDVLRNALNVAVDWDLIPRNVVLRVEAPKVPRYEGTVLTPPQVRHLLDVGATDRLAALWRVALSLGLREAEVLGLRWSDVDFAANTLTVNTALHIVNGKRVLGEPKTKHSRRTLPLLPSVVSALRAHRTRQLEEQLLAGTRWQEHGLVFASTVGTPLFASNVIRAFHKLLERAELPRMRFHDLRHSCASLLAAQGVPARVAMDILGHSNIATTLNIYTHVMDESKREAAHALERILHG